MQHRIFRRVLALVLAQVVLLGSLGVGNALAGECPTAGIGTTTGDRYELMGTRTRTETTRVQLSLGVCGTAAEGETTISTTYTVGVYHNVDAGGNYLVDCATGRILGKA